MRHPGEEFVYVLSGPLEVHLEGRDSLLPETRDSIYIDSANGHNYVSVGGDAEILVICWQP